MMPPHMEERRPLTLGAASNTTDNKAPTTDPKSAPILPEAPRAVDMFMVAELRAALASSEHGPSCGCGDWARVAALVLALAEAHDCTTHPVIVDSVRRMFGGWDGAEAAHARSVARFRTWHAQARATAEEVQHHDAA